VAVLTPFNVISFVRGTIWPGLKTSAMLLVLFPASAVLCTVEMAVCSKTMCFIIFPVAIVDVSVSVDEASLTVSLIIGPVAFIHRTIGPDLYALSLTHARAFQPLAFITGSIFEDDHISAFSIAELLFKLVVIVVERT